MPSCVCIINFIKRVRKNILISYEFKILNKCMQNCNISMFLTVPQNKTILFSESNNNAFFIAICMKF